MKNNIHDFKSLQGGSKEPSEMAVTAANFKAEMLHIIDFQTTRSKIKREYFESLVEEGFTPEQALHIVSTDTYI